MKKGILPLFLLLMVVSLISACSAPTPTQSAPAPTSAPVAASATPAGSYPPPANVVAPTTVAATLPAGYPAPAQVTQAPQTNLPAGYPVPGGGFMVTLVGGAAQTLSLDIIKSLATVNVNLEGKDQPYRKLGDALNKIGATGFKTVTVAGQNGTLQLNPDQVGQAYLDVQSDGSVRLLVQGLPAAQWPVNITAITLQ